jgi:hypothetical protein
MNESTTTRRRFLAATIAFAGLTGGTIGPAALRFGSAWAQTGVARDASTYDAIIRMARLLLPHDTLSDETYAEVFNDALTATLGDDQLTAVEDSLNAQQSAVFMRIDEEAQLAAMRAIENEAAFADVLAAFKTHLYNQPAAWEVLGYEGPSYQNGGYLNRGAGDIDWLPEGE